MESVPSPDGPAPRTGVSGRSLAAALPDFVLAAVFLGTWIWPARAGYSRVGHLTLVILLEFIIVHSAAFMGNVLISPLSREKKVMSTLGLGLFYSLFVGAFSLAFHSAWPLLSFWGLMANRMMSVIVGQAPEGEEREFVQASWAVGAMAYLAFTFLTMILPIPRLGLTPEVMPRLHLEGSGLWVSQPWRVMAFGMLYFGGVGWSELNDHRWLRARGVKPSATADSRRAA
jgi:hypothetical protein